MTRHRNTPQLIEQQSLAECLHSNFPRTRDLTSFFRGEDFTHMPLAAELTYKFTKGVLFDFASLKRIINDYGIPLVYSDKIPRGEGLLSPEGSFMETERGIKLNPNTPMKRQQYVLAHEFAHVLLSCFCATTGIAPAEPENYVWTMANHFIFPEQQAQETANKCHSLTELRKCANLLNLPLEVVVRRIHHKVRTYGFVLTNLIIPKGFTGKYLGIGAQGMPYGFSFIPNRMAVKQGLFGRDFESQTKLLNESNDDFLISCKERLSLLRKQNSWQICTFETPCEYALLAEEYCAGQDGERFLIGISLFD